MFDIENKLNVENCNMKRIYVCRLENTSKIFDIDNYLKIGVIKINKLND